MCGLPGRGSAGKEFFVAELATQQKIATMRERLKEQLAPIIEEALVQGLSRTLIQLLHREKEENRLTTQKKFT